MKKSLIIACLTLVAILSSACRNEREKGDEAAESTTDTAMTSSTSTTATETSSITLSAADRDFAMKAAEGGMAEVTLGQLATQRATNPEVKNFGNQMVNDHGKAGDELKQLATNKGVALPSDLNAEHKKLEGELSRKSGKDFDKAYMTEMVKDHEMDVKEFGKASRELQDSDLKNWASKTLPVIQDHLRMARQIAAKLK